MNKNENKGDKVFFWLWVFFATLLTFETGLLIGNHQGQTKMVALYEPQLEKIQNHWRARQKKEEEYNRTLIAVTAQIDKAQKELRALQTACK